MLDIKSVKEEAEKQIRDEKMKAAKEKIVGLLRKKEQAQTVLNNIDKEIADAYAAIGEGTTA